MYLFALWNDIPRRLCDIRTADCDVWLFLEFMNGQWITKVKTHNLNFSSN